MPDRRSTWFAPLTRAFLLLCPVPLAAMPYAQTHAQTLAEGALAALFALAALACAFAGWRARGEDEGGPEE